MTQPDPSPTRGGYAPPGARAHGGRRRTRWGVTPRAAAASPRDLHHVVLVTMENRSFDHFLGWVPGADGGQAGLTYLDAAGQPQTTSALAPDYQGCGHPDPDHSYDGGRLEVQCWRL